MDFQLLTIGIDGLAHVRVHVGDDEIHASIVVEIKKLNSHGAPRSLWKILFSFVNELLAAFVFKIVVVALHIQNE